MDNVETTHGNLQQWASQAYSSAKCALKNPTLRMKRGCRSVKTAIRVALITDAREAFPLHLYVRDPPGKRILILIRYIHDKTVNSIDQFAEVNQISILQKVPANILYI